MRKAFLYVHRWLALPSAVVLVVVCLSGSLFVFADEIMALLHKPYDTVESVGNTRLPLEEAAAIVQHQYESLRLANVILYKDPRKTNKFLLFSKEKGLCTVFADPFDGHIIGESRAHNFFYIVAHLHSELLLGPVGAWIVKVATLIFIVILLTGFFLWKPRRIGRNFWKNYVLFNPRATFKRLVYNHHRVFGFYAFGLLMLLALTGAIMAFEPLQQAVAKGFIGQLSSTTPVEPNPSERPGPISTLKPVLDYVAPLLEQPDVEMVKVALMSRGDTSVLLVVSGKKMGILTYEGSLHHFNKFTGAEINNPVATGNSEAENWLMKLHVGHWGGLIGKLLSFLAGLVGAYLVLTGLVIWWNKHRLRSRVPV